MFKTIVAMIYPSDQMLINQEDSSFFIFNGEKYELPDRSDKAYFKGKEFNFSEEFQTFLKSDKQTCIVPVYCSEVSEKRAFKSVIIETKTEEYRFTNSERGQYSYYRNEIKDIEKGGVYLIFLERFGRARNDCLIKAAIKMEDRRREVGACECIIGKDLTEVIKDFECNH